MLFSSAIAVNQTAFAQTSSPLKITFIGLKDECKVFEITDINEGKLGGGGRVMKVEVEGSNVKDSPTTVPVIVPVRIGSNFIFEKGTPVKIVITICPDDPALPMEFTLRAFSTAKELLQVRVHNVITEAAEGRGDDTFEAIFLVPKVGICDKVKKKFMEQKDVTLECAEKTKEEVKEFLEGETPLTGATFTLDGVTGFPTEPGTLVTVSGSANTPETLAVGVNPATNWILMVLEICSFDINFNLICPSNFSTSIIFTTIPIGGELLPLDTTALLLAGVQSISMWMIPVIVAGIGIGVFVIKLRKSSWNKKM